MKLLFRISYTVKSRVFFGLELKGQRSQWPDFVAACRYWSKGSTCMTTQQTKWRPEDVLRTSWKLHEDVLRTSGWKVFFTSSGRHWITLKGHNIIENIEITGAPTVGLYSNILDPSGRFLLFSTLITVLWSYVTLWFTYIMLLTHLRL